MLAPLVSSAPGLEGRLPAPAAPQPLTEQREAAPPTPSPRVTPWAQLKLQYFGHLMRRANSLEKTLMLAKEKGLAQDEMVTQSPGREAALAWASLA